MSGSAFAVTHHAFSSGAGRTSDGNGSHWSTSKSPSYTKSVSWQHYQSSLLNIQMSAPFMMNSLKDIEPEIKINPTMFSRFVKVNVKDFPLEKVDSLTSILDSERLSYELSENGYIKIKTQNPSERERAHQVLAFIRNTSP
ncbi:hypothetical protein [Leclercia adecarboxylata]|uniref:hypothetical protein n=1 Tax=Leclercia adecarboxylata TaxID=83655 RepID=UPI00177C7C41|nr:hypothetical protein [Leclercia adecarboxylata]